MMELRKHQIEERDEESSIEQMNDNNNNDQEESHNLQSSILNEVRSIQSEIVSEIKALESDVNLQTKKMFRAMSMFRKTAKEELSRSLAYTQKATLLKLLDDLQQQEEEGSKEKEKEAADEIEKHIHEIRDSIINTLSNLAILSALVGITTYSCVIKPMQPSVLDAPDHFSINGLRLTTILNMACTASALLTICLATSYMYILNNLLIELEDFIWFLMTVALINQCLFFCVTSVIFAILSLLISCYSLYSNLTANICVIAGTCLLSSFFFIILPILRRVFIQIDLQLQKKKTDEDTPKKK